MVDLFWNSNSNLGNLISKLVFATLYSPFRCSLVHSVPLAKECQRTMYLNH